jgi:xanthine dehydrogenase molybdenum-binding subunit
MGVKRDGTLTAQEMKVIDDTGAYAVFGEGICLLVLGFFFSHCKCPNTKFDGYTVYTNTPPACAMRGVGDQSVNFAIISHMDMIAEELGIDILDLILKNFKGVGDLFYGQGPTVTYTIKSCGSDYLIRKGAELIGWDRRKRLPKKGRVRQGIGVSLGFHTSGAGTRDRTSGILETTGAIVVFNDNGTATLNVALTERGTGNVSALAQIAAEELGIKYEDVIVLSEPATDCAPYNYMDHASRSVYAVGGIVKAAAADAKKKLLEWAAEMLKVSVDDLEVKGGQIFVNGSPKTTVAEVTKWANSPIVQLGTIIGSHSGRPIACPPSFVTYFIEVMVDTETGETKVVKAVAGADVGTVINPDGLEAQLGGGLHMGLGYALTEELCIDEVTGKILNSTPTDYKMLTSADMPELKTFFADTVEPTGPFGAKGVGEAAFNPVASAVANAIYNATGIRFRELPITPEKILRAIKEKKKR